MFGLLKDEQGKLIDIDVTITRADLAQLLTPVVQRVVSIAKQILHEIRFDLELIDTVLMVGGSSLIPAIQDALKDLFGAEKVIIHPRPMLAVAEGAALMAAKINCHEDSSTETNFVVMHSTAHNYYLQLADGKRHLLVARNTPLPFSVEEKLKFTYETQSLARLRVFNEVDGVLEIVGELWFHKEYAEDFTKKPPHATELMLHFSVDEDNIINMKAWDVQNPTRSVEAQIARGGLSAKLYNDLERTLSSIIANSHSACIEDDALQLSRAIVTTILSASDPITGETRITQKLKAQQQINTLKSCNQKNLAPLSMYSLLLTAQQQAENILTIKEKARLKNLLQNLKDAIDNLSDIAILERVVEDLESFYIDIPIAADLARAENAAVAIEDSSPGEANKIRRQAKVLADLHIQQNKAKEESARDSLYELMDSLLYWSDTPSGRFDRDVCV
jgi:molecular chaperone DnaK